MSSHLINLYRQALRKSPTLMQGLQASVLMASGDIIAQRAVEKTPIRDVNWRRTGQFAGMGLVFVGPSLKIWYGKLETMIGQNQQPWKRAVKKMSIDQLAFAPVFTAAFTSVLSVIQGLNQEEILQRLQRDYGEILKTNYKLWPAAQLINFLVIPLNFQVVFAQCVAVVWNTYLSMVLGNSKLEERKS